MRQYDTGVVNALNDLIDRGYRFLESRGWYRYEDGIAPPDLYRHGHDSTEEENKFRKALGGLQELRAELSEEPQDIPF